MSQAFKFILVFCLGIFCLTSFSCAPKTASQSSVWPANADIHWLDTGLKSKLDIFSVDISQTKSDIPALYIQIKNLSSRTVHFAYRVDWFTAKGRKIRGGTSHLWKHKELLGNDMGYIRDVAPNQGAFSAQIGINKADPSPSAPQNQTKEK